MKKIDFSTTFGAAWDPFVKNLGPLAIAGLVVYLIAFMLPLIVQKIAPSATGMRVSSVIQFLVMAPLFAGLCGMTLKILRGQTPETGDVFNAFQRAGHCYILALVPAVVLFILGAILILPAMGAGAMTGNILGMLAGAMVGILIVGVVALVITPFFALGYPAVADGLSGVDALQFSFRQGAANWVPLFLLFLVSIILGSLASAITCTLGLIVVIPWWMMIASVAHTRLSPKATRSRLRPTLPCLRPRRSRSLRPPPRRKRRSPRPR